MRFSLKLFSISIIHMNLSIRKIIGKFRPYNGVKTQLVLQLSATECGVAALAMVMGYYGVHSDLAFLRKSCGTSRDGVKAATLIKVAESFGFEAAAYRVELDDIAVLSHPVIAYWRFNHYVVIHGVGDQRVFMNDPALGAISVSFAEFDKSFTGIVISLTPTASVIPLKARSQWQPMLLAWFNGNGFALSLLMVCMLIAITAPMLSTRITAIFIDYCVIGRNSNWLPAFAITSVVLGLAMLIALRLQKITQFRLSMKASMMKSAEMMQHLLRLPLLYFTLRQKPEVATMISRAEIIATTLFQGGSASLISAVSSLVSLLFLIKIDGFMTIILLLLLCLLLVPASIITRMNTSYEQSNVTAISHYYSCSLSNIKNIETIKTCGIEATVLVKWIASLHQKINIQDQSNSLLLLLKACSQLFNSMSMFLTLFVGSIRVAEGKISVGGLIAFYGLQLCFTSQVMAILHLLKDWQSTYATQIQINDIFDHQVDCRFQLAKHPTCMESDVILVCREMSFTYNPVEPPILSDINLDISCGQHVAFVGSTGSGKSTLVKILAHLYPPATGKLLLYGNECQQGGADSLPALFAYVSQEITLFSGTIYDNLTLWKRGVAQSVIEAAIHDACLTELIQQRGLYGKVEEGGCNFSGGERQRLDIARALIQSPAILVLDEATAALDVATEATLINNIRKRTMTILFVAHRLSTVKHCDQIFVIKDGCIIERGHHEELMSNQAHYRELLHNERVMTCNP